MIKFGAYLIWEFAEFFCIDLGRLAPHVFGLMIGVKGQKVKDKED